MSIDAPIEIASQLNVTASVIWLHGLGADGHDFEPVVNMLNLPHVRFILPHAPYRKVTRNNGYEMRAWYDIYGVIIGSREDAQGIRESQTTIDQLIKHEMDRGIAANRIVLAGFSQGGAVVLHTALRYQQALAGVIALSTYLPLKANLGAEKVAANQAIPIFMAHGSHDEVITMDVCLSAKQTLVQEKYAIDWHPYNMAHSVCPPEIDDIKQFLLRVLPII
jgi:phospholipase/carboxylesterase